jgi:hypothetical protein
MAYAYTVRHTRQAHHHSYHKHHSVASVPRYPVEPLTFGPLRRSPYNARYLLSTLPAMPPMPVLHNRAVTLDYEDFTLYAPYRAGHAGSQASPWRLPPLLAWLPSSPRRLLYWDLEDFKLFDYYYYRPPPYSERNPTWATLTSTTPRRWLLHLDSFTLHGYHTNGLSARRASPWLLSLVLPYVQRGTLHGLRLARALHLHRRCRRTESAPLPGPLSPYHPPLRCTTPWTTSRSVATVPPPPHSGRASPWPLSLTTHRTSGCATCLPC